jgi:2-keto-4-pentenoate hydratase/2-oxohepta-3-ene-1,7-dioic acid hydratase in catechol pathway
MKIIRYIKTDQVRYGILEAGIVIECDGDPFDGLTRTRKAHDLSGVRLLPPVTPPNIICLGLNYKKHADETGLPRPAEPLFFMKSNTSLCGPGDDIILPAGYPDQIDFEAELAIVVRKRAKNVSESEAADFILGFTAANDISNRAVQFSDGQWVRAKSYDTFCPIGPAVVTDIDGDDLDVVFRLDGQVMQSSNTSDMIFGCRKVVSHLSRCMTLLPGTIILTGTPEGVGFTRKPPVFLRPGQKLETEIEGIGVLVNLAAAAERS